MKRHLTALGFRKHARNDAPRATPGRGTPTRSQINVRFLSLLYSLAASFLKTSAALSPSDSAPVSRAALTGPPHKLTISRQEEAVRIQYADEPHSPSPLTLAAAPPGMSDGEFAELYNLVLWAQLRQPEPSAYHPPRRTRRSPRQPRFAVEALRW